MARPAEAERERRAKVIAAEGELQASARLRDSAGVLNGNPMSLQLRYLQTVFEMSSERASTTILPLPIELPIATRPCAGSRNRARSLPCTNGRSRGDGVRPGWRVESWATKLRIEVGDGPSSSQGRGPRSSPIDPADPDEEVIVATKRAARSPSGDGTSLGDALVVELLTHAYWMELKTVADYLAASVNLDGIRGAGVGEALAADVTEELEHARRLAQRLKELGATVPGSLSFAPERRSLQPLDDEADVVRVIEGVLDAEEAAIGHYRDLIEQTDGLDWVTQALAVQLLGGEEAHRRRFQGYLREYRR